MQFQKPKVAFHTLGCKLNIAETSSLGKQFLEHGFEIVDIHSPTNVVVLNTCSVTERADKEARQWIRRALRISPDAFVSVIGCYAQLEPEKIASINGVDAVLGAKEKLQYFNYIQSFEKKYSPSIFVSEISEANEFGPAFSSEVGGRTRAFLKVQDGCDYNCTFCTIPLARGESRSQSIEDCVLQAQQISDMGFKEIVLTGVNVGDFGKKNQSSFLQLLNALENVKGIDRYRISSIEPNLLTKEIIDFVLNSDKFCNHFHIPLQSGSDYILKQMRRRYTTSDYLKTIEYIKSKDDYAGIGVDVITGFPGETETHFEETYRFLAELQCSYLHVFTYSERPNTPAAVMQNKIEPKIRFKRNEMLRILSGKKRNYFHTSIQGKVFPVLIEQKQDEKEFSGFTSNYARVVVDTDESSVNKVLNVQIDSSFGDHCLGTVIKDLTVIQNKSL